MKHKLAFAPRCSPLLPALAAALLLPVAAAVAAPLTVVNHSFEEVADAVTVYNEFTFGAPDGWVLYDPDSITGGATSGNYFIGTLAPSITPQTDPPDTEWFDAGAPDGSRVAIPYNRAGTGGQGEWGLEQTLTGVALQPFTQYTLQVEIGNIDSGTAVDSTFYNLAGFPGYRVELLAGGVVIAADDNTLAGSIPESAWATSTVTYTTDASPAAGDLGIRLISLNEVDNTNATTAAADLEVDFDNVRLDATIIPEPTAAALLIGAGALLCRRPRRHTAH